MGSRQSPTACVAIGASVARRWSSIGSRGLRGDRPQHRTWWPARPKALRDPDEAPRILGSKHALQRLLAHGGDRSDTYGA